DMTSLRDNEGRLVALPALEDALAGCLDAIRNIQVQRPQNKRFDTNRILMYVWPPAELSMDELNALVQRILPTTAGAGLEEVQFVARQRTAAGDLSEVSVRITLDPSNGASVHLDKPSTEPGLPLDDYRQKVLRAARRGNPYPYELTTMRAGAEAKLVEHDLHDEGVLVPVDRAKRHHPAATRPRRWVHSRHRNVHGGPRRAAGPRGCGSRRNGAPARPEPGSRCPRAPRTWTGSRPRSNEASNSPGPGVRSTSWSPGSPWVP